ncbi:MAG: ATP-dependent zinc metalloprotease FtsH [Acidobacteriota bacterium]
MNSTVRNITLWVVILIVAYMVFRFFSGPIIGDMEVQETRFYELMDQGQIASVTITPAESGYNITGKLRDAGPGGSRTFQTFVLKNEDLSRLLRAKNVEISTKKPSEGTYLVTLLSWAPMLLIIGVWIFFMRQMQTGGNRALSFGKSKAKLLSAQGKKVTFRDVAGIEEAKEELHEIIDFLREPQKFQRLGGRIPKGVLLMGPPGTGKTLLARAIAGEANVPFFSISGSDFVEMFVGVGASRVRDLFEQGKKNAPCIVFIDEIDAVGRHRGAGLGGGHDEREQTLNQLLVEMDGFESNEGVILIAATNRPDVLDPALLRPGRFDRRVVVNLPDVRGREGILRVHTRKIPLDDDVDVGVLGRGTPGFSGADLANLANEAALIAARKERKAVAMNDFESAKDKVMLGSERRSLILSDEEKRNTAYHEAGHALMAHLLTHADPLHKVTIIPRGMALGVTMQLPIDDRHTYTRDYIVDAISVALGGRAAEEIFLDHLTTGAGDDLIKSTDLARKMVCEYGMTEALGPLTYGKKEEQIFLGRDFTQVREYSESTAMKIDEEIRRIVNEQYAKTRRILQEHRPALAAIAHALLEREVLDGKEIAALCRGEQLPAQDSAAAATVGESGPQQQAALEPDAPSSEESGGRAPIAGPVEQPG